MAEVRGTRTENTLPTGEVKETTSSQEKTLLPPRLAGLRLVLWEDGVSLTSPSCEWQVWMQNDEQNDDVPWVCLSHQELMPCPLWGEHIVTRDIGEVIAFFQRAVEPPVDLRSK